MRPRKEIELTLAGARDSARTAIAVVEDLRTAYKGAKRIAAQYPAALDLQAAIGPALATLEALGKAVGKVADLEIEAVECARRELAALGEES